MRADNKRNTKKIVSTSLTIVAILVLILAILAASFFGVLLLRDNKVPAYEMGTTLSAPVSFHTDLQAGFLNEKFYWNIKPYGDGTKELSRPKALNVSWNTVLPSTGYYAVFSEYEEDMRDPIVYPLGTDAQTDVYNLKVGTTYYCQIHFPLSVPISEIKTITTDARPPRNMYVDGVTNVRDLGGWAIPGGRVKQGLIYRCGRLNENRTEKITPKITEDGVRTMLDVMKIRSEMDLRKVEDNEVGGLTDTSVLGAGVNYYQCPMGWDNNMLLNNIPMVKHIFSDILSKEDNYPLIFHCSIGTDRTGMIAFMLNGLLGVDINDLYRDYLFSNFGDIGGNRDVIGITFNYVATLQSTKGKTFSEKVENYLLSIGVTKAEIESIRTILSEK